MISLPNILLAVYAICTLFFLFLILDIDNVDRPLDKYRKAYFVITAIICGLTVVIYWITFDAITNSRTDWDAFKNFFLGCALLVILYLRGRHSDVEMNEDELPDEAT